MSILEVALAEWPEFGGPVVLGRTTDPELVRAVREHLAAQRRRGAGPDRARAAGGAQLRRVGPAVTRPPLDPRRAAFARSLGLLVAELVWRQLAPEEPQPPEKEEPPGKAAPSRKDLTCNGKSLTRSLGAQDPGLGA